MSQDLFTREEAQAGLPAKRARTALFLIESQTARLVAQARQAMERFLSEEAAQERDLAFLEAFALGREPPLRPTIQDLERYAAQWAFLVPDNPRVRAALAHLLSQKYRFSYQAVPGLRAALGLDEEAVQQAYQRLYGQPLATIFAPQAKPLDRLRWAWAALAKWLESLPPFWTAFSLTVTETVGAGILALPIALAGVGPLAGFVLLIVLGLVNVFTIAAMAEAVARSGTIRYGSAYTGRVVTDYLGRAGAIVLVVGLAVLNFLTLLAYYTGFATFMAEVTMVPAMVWCALLFLVGLYFLRRESLNATVALALLVGAVNIGLILLLSLLAFTHVRLEYLLYVNVPFLGGRPFEPSILGLIFGVILTAYFGHMSLSNCAQVVLRRDPSARSLIWGSVAGMLTAIVLYGLWVLAVNGVVAPQDLAGLTGTALPPLAAQVGPIVTVLGGVYVILGMTISSIHTALGLVNLVRERLPSPHRPVIVLPRQRPRLVFHPRGKPSGRPRLGLTYLGLVESPGRAPQPQFRLDVQLAGETHSLEMAVTDRWDDTALLDQLPGLRQQGARLAWEVLEASPESVRLRVTSPLALAYAGEWDTTGRHVADVLELPDTPRQLVQWLLRRGEASLAEVAAHSGQDERAARSTLAALSEQGFVREVAVEGQVRYRPQLAPHQRRQLPANTWQALGVDDGPRRDQREQRGQRDQRGQREQRGQRGQREQREQRGQRDQMDQREQREQREQRDQTKDHGLRTKDQGPRTKDQRPTGFRARLWAAVAALGRRGRFLLAVSPAAVAFLLVEWLLSTGNASFPGPLSLIGVIVCSLLGGVFPVLLLVASRRKGEFVPGVVYRFLGQPVLLGVIYLLFLAGIFLHGLVIWQGLVERAGALLVGVLILVLTLVVVRRGAFARRMVVELRADMRAGGRSALAIATGGQPVPAEVRLGYPQGEQHYQAASGEVPTPAALRYAICQLPVGPAKELKVWAHKVTPEGESEALPALVDVRCGDKTTRLDLKLSGGQALLPLTGEVCRLEITLRRETS
jgi:hypothetical protein